MENAIIKVMIKEEPSKVIGIIEERVREIDFLERLERNDILDYISAKVKGTISPMLRLARKFRRQTYPEWVEFQELLEYFGLKDTLTRDNNYSPIPKQVLIHWDSMAVETLERYIIFFNKLHDKEDKRYKQIFVQCFEDWVKPALLYAFERVDTEKSEREIVSYICKAFETKYIELRAKSQGMNRVRREGKWHYYKINQVNEEDFRELDIMQTIFHEERVDYPSLDKMTSKLTKKQTHLLIDVYNYVRDDVRNLTTEEFYEKYPHKRMKYRRMSEEMGKSYDSFVKSLQRIKKRIS